MRSELALWVTFKFYFFFPLPRERRAAECVGCATQRVPSSAAGPAASRSGRWQGCFPATSASALFVLSLVKAAPSLNRKLNFLLFMKSGVVG